MGGPTGKRIVGITEDGKNYLTNYGEGNIPIDTIGETTTVAKRVSPIENSNIISPDNILEDVTFVGEGTGGEALPKTFAQRTGDFVKDTATDIKDYVVEGDFVPDAALNIVGSELFGEEEEQSFAQGPVADQPLMEAAQGNYIRDVGPSAMAATGMTRMPSFQELSQQTLYGTGSPSWMAQFYQPLLTPQGIG